MIIYPAIDLIDGAVVRLHKGDFAQKTTYGSDPVAVARAYAEAGALWCGAHGACSSGTNICRFKIGASNDDSAGLPFFTTSTRLFVRAAASGRRDSRDAMCAGGLVDQNGNPITDEHGNAVVQEGGAAGLAAAPRARRI